MKIIRDGQGGSTGPCLKGKSITDQAGGIAEFGCQFGHKEPVGASGHPGGAGDDLMGDADLIHFHHTVDIVSDHLHGQAGKTHEMVRYDNDSVRILIVREGIAQTPAGGGAVKPVGVPEGVGCGGGDDRNVNLNLPVLDGLISSPVRSQHSCARHLSLGGGFTQGTVHAPLYVVDRAVFQVPDQGGMAGK